jgi:MFS family permease
MVPKGRRGFVGGVLQGAYPIGFFLVSVVTSNLLSASTPPEYLLWGWRIAFIIGAILAFLFLIYYAAKVPESSLWMQSEKSSAPLKVHLNMHAKAGWWTFNRALPRLSSWNGRSFPLDRYHRRTSCPWGC